MRFIEKLRLQKQIEYEELRESERRHNSNITMAIEQERRRLIRNQNLADKAQVNLDKSGIIPILSELSKVLEGKSTPVKWNEYGKWDPFVNDSVDKAFGRGTPMSRGLLFEWDSGEEKGYVNVRVFVVEATYYGDVKIRGGRFGNTALHGDINVDALDKAIEKAYRYPIGYAYRHVRVLPGDDSWSGGEGD